MKKSRWRALALGPWMVGVFACAALFGPWLAPQLPGEVDLAHAYELASPRHWLGTGDNGVDLGSAVLYGARVAAFIATWVVALNLLLGASLGLLAGYLGGICDHLVSGAADLLQAFPAIVLQIAILALAETPGMPHLILALVIPGWTIYARIARAEALRLRALTFVEAAQALGYSRRRILLRHIAPNLLGPLMSQAASGFGYAILAEATLSYLGLGPSLALSWGALLDQGSAVLLRFPHVTLVAGSAMAFTVLGFHLSGDWLRDRWDLRA